MKHRVPFRVVVIAVWFAALVMTSIVVFGSPNRSAGTAPHQATDLGGGMSVISTD